MYTILCVIELLKAACPSTLPLKNGGDTRESNRAFDVENILSFPNIDDIAVKVKEYIRVLMQLRSRPLIYPQSYPLLTCIV